MHNDAKNFSNEQLVSQSSEEQTSADGSCTARRENFAEWDNTPFSRRAIDAAEDGRIKAGALLNTLDRVYAVTRGLEQICKLAAANRVQEEHWKDREQDDDTQPPMSPNTVEGLLALGEAAAGMIVNDIHHVSDWLDKYGIREGQQ
jgi:hypothetical protein